jgi:glycosyltransferase involved in cell wall biosynthesis
VGHLLRGGIEMWLYQTLQKLDVTRFEHHVLVRTDKEEPFTEAFRQAGFRVVPCLNYSNPLKYARNLRRVVDEYGPYDVLHVHGSNPNGLLALLCARSFGIKTRIVHSHNDVRPLLTTRGFIYNTYVNLTLQCFRRFADLGFACSELAGKSMFGSSWENDSRWRLLHYGVNFKPFSEPPDRALRAELGIPDRSFVVGHVGRFHAQKNHDFLVQIADAAVQRSPDVHFLLVGDGPLRGSITAELKRRGLDRHVTFVPDTMVIPRFMLSAMDCFVFPSRYEGLGLVAVEAQAAGLPCVVSDRVPREAIVDPSLVNVLSLDDSPGVWAESLLRARQAGNSQPSRLDQFYASSFNLDRCALSLAGAYESVSRQ